jgi:hypothetical protein
MSERLTKLIDKYADMKRGVERRAWTVVVIGLVLAAASRSPQFTFKDPTGMVVGEAHNGYIVVFGLPIVFGLFWYFQSAFMETLSFARLVRTPAGDEKLKDSEVFLLRPPFTLTVRVHRCSCKFCSDVCARAGAVAVHRCSSAAAGCV